MSEEVILETLHDSGYASESSSPLPNVFDAVDALDLQSVIDSWRWRFRKACKLTLNCVTIRIF